MLMIVTRLVAIIGILLAAPAVASEPEAVSTVVVEPRGEGYRAVFAFSVDAPVWAFHRSALRHADRKSWRPESWRVVTPGVSLARAGAYDVLVADNGTVPRSVTIDFTPAAIGLLGDYDPALVLTDGTTAIFSGMFTSFPAGSLADVERLSEPLPAETRIVFRSDDIPVFHEGASSHETIADGTTYAIFGHVGVAEGDAVARILDPGLPRWIADTIDRTAPAVVDYYSARIMPFTGPRPLILASWVPSDMAGASQGGSVLPGMITMRFEGQALLQENRGMADRVAWFIAHELAHNWLGQMLRYDNPDRAWIVEGGADLMALHAVGSDGADIAALPLIEQARTDCAALLAGGGVETARRRNEHRAYYACGMVFALAVERSGANRDEDFLDFVRRLINDNPDGVISGDEWLATARAFGLPHDKEAIIRRLLEEGSSSGAQDIDALIGLASTGRDAS